MKHYSRVESSWKQICVSYLCQLKISSSPIYFFFFPCRIWPKTVTSILNFPFGSALGAKNRRVQVWFHCAVRRPQEKKNFEFSSTKCHLFPVIPCFSPRLLLVGPPAVWQAAAAASLGLWEGWMGSGFCHSRPCWEGDSILAIWLLSLKSRERSQRAENWQLEGLRSGWVTVCGKWTLQGCFLC